MIRKLFIGLVVIIGTIVVLVVAIGWHLSSHIPDDLVVRFSQLPYYEDGKFFNEERQAEYEIGWQSVKDQFGEGQRVPPSPPPVVDIDPGRFERPPAQALTVNWLGHSSVMVEFDGYRLLIDPVFSERASPFSFIGPKRFHRPPIALDQVRAVDAVIVSHNHYDHFDEPTIRYLAAQGSAIFVPLGVGERLKSWDIPAAQIHSLEWWQERTIRDLKIVATPTRHYSGRGLFDYKETHWASWSMIGPGHRVFYSGDSGYSKLFRRVGEQLGPFDLTVIKVGSYGPDQAWLDIHMTPENAVRVHGEVNGARMLPVHWATFNLAYHDWDEPIRRTVAAAAATGAVLVTPRIGETVTSDIATSFAPWWESVR